MPNLGLQILYDIINNEKGMLAERAYAPGFDLEEELRFRRIPLFSWESKKPLNEFDIVGFSLQYEMTFTNILTMLDLSGIPLYAQERKQSDPLIIGGGPITYNPEPMAPFFDLFVIGEGEEVILELVDTYKEYKVSGAGRQQTLEELAKLKGVYVPSFYNVEYEASGKIKEISPESDKYPEAIKRRVIADLNTARIPQKPLVPFSEVIHDRLSVEIMRGCTRGCRFCQAGMIYRPVRERSQEILLSAIENQLRSTGYEEVSLCSLSSGDFSNIDELLKELARRYSQKGISLSLPSLRMDSFSVGLANEIARVKKSGLTFAPEAGTQRLRDVINKDITEEDVNTTVEAALSSGWRKFKLYFMIGLPTETDDDLTGMVDLAQNIAKTGLSIIPRNERRKFDVILSVSCFTPKPWVPFQWQPQDSLSVLEEKQNFLKRNLTMCHIKLKWHDARQSLLEGVFARGDRRLSEVIKCAWEKGCKFDAWSESFRFSLWEEAFEECGLSMELYANRERELEEVLPWDHINCGVSKEFLWSEYQRALKGERTPDCRVAQCSECGVC